jgi:hypothetical protein
MPFELLTKHNFEIYAFDEYLNLSKKIFFTQKKSWMFLFGNLFNSNKILPSKLTPCGIEKNLVILILLHP